MPPILQGHAREEKWTSYVATAVNEYREGAVAKGEGGSDQSLFLVSEE